MDIYKNFEFKPRYKVATRLTRDERAGKDYPEASSQLPTWADVAYHGKAHPCPPGSDVAH